MSEKEGKGIKDFLARLFKGNSGSGCCCNIQIIPEEEADKQRKPNEDEKK